MTKTTRLFDNGHIQWEYLKNLSWDSHRLNRGGFCNWLVNGIHCNRYHDHDEEHNANW